MLKIFCLFNLLFCFAGVYATESRKYEIAGVVRDKGTGIVMEYATVGIEELGKGALTGLDGKFRLEDIPAGQWNITVQYLGYAPLTLSMGVARDTALELAIDRLTLELNEVKVRAEYNQSGTSMKISKSALEHIQPTSLADVFQLLPGYLSTDGEMNNVNQVTSRQAGSDKNTALGMAIIRDGAPISNNANLSVMNGRDGLMKERSTVNAGIDLRLLSTDHLEQVEVIPGISSVLYGDLSSGVVLLKSKTGYSPLEMRIKADPRNKLAYIGKGFKLGEKRGTLNLGSDIIQAKPDVRENLQTFTRITAQAMYTNQKNTRIGNWRYSIQGTYTGTIDKEKNDPDLTLAEDTYSATYNYIGLAYNTVLQPEWSGISKLEMTVSGDYTADILNRDKTVSLTGPMPLPLAQQVGEQEGLYLPTTYVSRYRVENRPSNFFWQFTAVSNFELGNINHRVLAGLENRTAKNLGEGAIYDLERPPFPTSSASSRPRALRSVRAMVNNAVFAEDQIRYRYLSHQWGLTVGIRLTNPANLPSEYLLHGKWFAEPRINLGYTYSGMHMGKWESSLTIRGGYGEQVKFPTLDMLYPDRVWFDEIAANYYSQTPENRFLWVNTQMKDRENPRLSVNRNKKYEIGAAWQVGDFRLDLTFFQELSNSGFESATNYFSFQYTKYDNPAVLPSGKPGIEDFTPRPDTLLKSYTTAINASRLKKRGVEYRLVIPRIDALHTEVELNGAYYKTFYDLSMPTQNRPQTVVNGKPYPYAGIYAWNSDSRYREQFNTNIWIRTHIPRFRLLFSALLQTVWFTSSKTREFSGIPVAYIDPAGVAHPFTEKEESDIRFQPLIQKFSENYFKEDRTPVTMNLNLKATKEIGKHLKISFMVNRLWDYNPKYKTKMNGEDRNWVIPAFAAELGIKI